MDQSFIRGLKIAGISLVVVVVFSLLAYYAYTKTQKFSVIFFDIGQGDAALIRFPTGEKMLVDCGPDRSVLSKLGERISFFNRTLDYLVVTHPDRDHYGGCVDVLKRYAVKNIVINGREKAYDEYFQYWKQAMLEEGANIEVVKEYHERIIGGVTTTFFSPDPILHIITKEDDNNNYSIVFKLTLDNHSYLFAGDMEQPLEEALLKKYCAATATLCPTVQADVFKVGHHGSDSSTYEPLLKAVQPKQAIISAGRDNRYGHPSLRVLKRLERIGATILRTDQMGDIVIP